MNLVDNIMEFYQTDIAQEYEARGWYTLAQTHARRLARENGITVASAAGVIAALSPMNQWGANLAMAERVITAKRDGELVAPRAGLRTNVLKAWEILHGARPLSVLSGPKVRSFYRNMTGDQYAVTVDRWAARAAGVADDYPRTQSRYDEVADAYREAAARVGLTPAVFQAVVWCSIRGRSN